MFSNSRNVLLHGVTLNSFEGGKTTDEGLKILYKHAAAGAVHNSGERFPPPQCHPTTRLEIQDEIVAWLNDLESPHLAMWMRGAAGAGKSAIAQTIAQILEEPGQLSSSFFFNRTSATGRSDIKKLVATLAYQMSKHIPDIRPFISANILADPLVFEMSLESQLEALIIKPLSLLSDTIENDQLPRLIIIDGLDECSNKDRAQSHVVTTFILALSRMQHKVPHKLLVASRPEYDIQEAFRNRKVLPLTRQLHLDDTWKPDDDIRTFLLDSLKEISLTHPLFRSREVQWPSEDDIQHLVRKSSGQFIYASVVIKYIQSNRHDPRERLDIILKLAPDSRNRPYSELDSIYVHLFSNLEDSYSMLCFLRLHLIALPASLYRPYSSITLTINILTLSKTRMELAFMDLNSIIAVDRGTIAFLHASLPDFLLDEERSGQFFANSEKICLKIAWCCLDYISNINHNRDFSWGTWAAALTLSFRGLLYFTENILLTALIPMYETISSINIPAILCDQHSASTEPDKDRGFPFLEIALFINRIVIQNKELFLAARYSPLAKAVMQIKQWFTSCFQKFPFNGFDNTDGLDLWIYAGTADIDSDIELVSLVTRAFFARDPSISIIEEVQKMFSPCIQFCWKVIRQKEDVYPQLLFFQDFELFGQYCMSSRRYTCAALLHCRNLKNTPELFYVFGEYPWQAEVTWKCLGMSEKPNREIYSLLKPLVDFNGAELYIEDIDEGSGMKHSMYPTVNRAYSWIWNQFSYRHLNKKRHEDHCREFTYLARVIVDYVEESRRDFPEIDQPLFTDNEDGYISDEGFETAEEDEIPEDKAP